MPPRVVNRRIIGNLTPENMNFSVDSQPRITRGIWEDMPTSGSNPRENL